MDATKKSKKKNPGIIFFLDFIRWTQLLSVRSGGPNHFNHDLFTFQAHRPAHLIKKNCIQTRNRKNKKGEQLQLVPSRLESAITESDQNLVVGDYYL